MLVRVTQDGREPVLFVELARAETDALVSILGNVPSPMTEQDQLLLEQLQRKVKTIQIQHALLDTFLPESLGGHA